jgi:putative glycerol-1-phosphate prenyltransferase
VFSSNEKQLAILIDPGKYGVDCLVNLLQIMQQKPPHYILVGGSTTSSSMDETINLIRQYLDVPVILFPGNASQFTPKADALMYLSLISGRNPDYLIGQHVLSSISIKKSGLKVVPVGYMLIESGRMTSVEYISNTKPIPSNKSEIAVCTAVAGELLGMQSIYLEAGSGADHPVPAEMIKAVKKNISIPLIVGGGIRTVEALKNAYASGADVVVVGNILEEKPELYHKLFETLTLL